MREVEKFFQTSFQHPPTYTVQAPGRLELLGNHTDYNQGLVMALAIDREIFLSVSPRRDGRIELVSSAFPGVASCSAHEITRLSFADALVEVRWEVPKDASRVITQDVRK